MQMKDLAEKYCMGQPQTGRRGCASMVSRSLFFVKSILCVSANTALIVFPLFFHPQKMHYNALFGFVAAKTAL